MGNVRKGQFRREIPEKAAEYFAYYLDEEGELLCAEMREKSCLREKELVTVEAHRVLDWTDNISIYSYSANGGPISELMVYVRDDRDGAGGLVFQSRRENVLLWLAADLL